MGTGPTPCTRRYFSAHKCRACRAACRGRQSSTTSSPPLLLSCVCAAFSRPLLSLFPRATKSDAHVCVVLSDTTPAVPSRFTASNPFTNPPIIRQEGGPVHLGAPQDRGHVGHLAQEDGVPHQRPLRSRAPVQVRAADAGNVVSEASSPPPLPVLRQY